LQWQQVFTGMGMNPIETVMDPWNNTEKNKVVAEAGRLIVDEGWNENNPLNALYHAHVNVLPAERTAPKAALIEACGRTEESIFKSVATKVKKLRKAAE
jgi:hypothetical protein